MTTNKPTERPILFNDEMVRAILDGRKTQTRRVVKPQPELVTDRNESGFRKYWKFNGRDVTGKRGEFIKSCPYGQPGDRLWVRESMEEDCAGSVSLSRYCADSAPVLYSDCDDPAFNGSVAHWNYPRNVRPSIHMPRWASRITLEITGVRVERLQDISEEDADAECFGGDFPGKALPDLFPGDPERWSHLSMPECFARLWEAINGPGSWEQNPWVWVVEFRRIEP